MNGLLIALVLFWLIVAIYGIRECREVRPPWERGERRAAKKAAKAKERARREFWA